MAHCASLRARAMASAPRALVLVAADLISPLAQGLHRSHLHARAPEASMHTRGRSCIDRTCAGV